LDTDETTKITALAERAGMIGFAMFSRGHIHDKTILVTIQSWGALEFIREVLKRDPADVAALFELWAVSRERGTSFSKVRTARGLTRGTQERRARTPWQAFRRNAPPSSRLGFVSRSGVRSEGPY
jgi:hypothetical protein